MGKIYGVMDDLRLENERVQQKYIAMTKLLIDSTDIDGYRVDTPMQASGLSKPFVVVVFLEKWPRCGMY